MPDRVSALAPATTGEWSKNSVSIYRGVSVGCTVGLQTEQWEVATPTSRPSLRSRSTKEREQLRVAPSSGLAYPARIEGCTLANGQPNRVALLPAPADLDFLKTGVLWISYAKDLPWFEVSAKSYARNARGFDQAKVVVPTPDVEAFRPAAEAAGIAVVGFDEKPGKGMLHHEVMVCYGDLHLPESDFIVHVDSDCVFAAQCGPHNYFNGDKPIMVYRNFEGMLSKPAGPEERSTVHGCDGRTVDLTGGQYFWKTITEYALGFYIGRSTMQHFPIIFPRAIYQRVRKHLEDRFGMGFEDYVFSCRNEFPQTFCEFETLGGYAQKFMEGDFHWRDMMTEGRLYPYLVQTWSRGGFDLPADMGKEYGGYQTPRQLFQKLGFL